jgi:CRP-like cAMP-binding protein
MRVHKQDDEGRNISSELVRVGMGESGDSFGELAIMDEKLKPRAATVVARADTLLAWIDRVHYLAMIGKY